MTKAAKVTWQKRVAEWRASGEAERARDLGRHKEEGESASNFLRTTSSVVTPTVDHAARSESIASDHSHPMVRLFLRGSLPAPQRAWQPAFSARSTRYTVTQKREAPNFRASSNLI